MYHVRKSVAYYVWVDVEFDLPFDPSSEDLDIDQWMEYDRAWDRASPDFTVLPGYCDHDMQDTQETEITEIK